MSRPDEIESSIFSRKERKKEKKERMYRQRVERAGQNEGEQGVEDSVLQRGEGPGGNKGIVYHTTTTTTLSRLSGFMFSVLDNAVLALSQ